MKIDVQQDRLNLKLGMKHNDKVGFSSVYTISESKRKRLQYIKQVSWIYSIMLHCILKCIILAYPAEAYYSLSCEKVLPNTAVLVIFAFYMYFFTIFLQSHN